MLSVKLRRDCFVVPPRKDGSIERHCEERSNLKLLKYIFNLIVVYIGIFYSISFAFSQNKESQPDSLKTVIKNIHKPEEICNLYNILALKYEESNLDSALLYSKKALNIAKKFTNRKLIADTYYSLGVTYKNKNITDSANFYLFNALKVYENITDIENVIKTNIAIGEYYRGAYLLNKAVTYEKLAIKISLHNNIYKYLPSAYNRLGAIYYELSVNNSVIDSFYSDTVNLAIRYIDSSIFWTKKINMYQYNVSNNNILGACYKNLFDYDKSNKYLLEALNDAKINNEVIEIPMIYRNLGTNFFKQKKYDEALNMVLNSAKMADSLGLSICLWQSYYALYSIYGQMLDCNKALYYLKKADSLQSIVFNENVTAKTKEFEAKYKTKESELLIEQQKTKLKKNQQLFIYFIIALIFTLLMIVISVFFTLRMRRVNSLLEEKNQIIAKTNEEVINLSQFKDDLSRMIVHDLKNPLNTILNYSKTGYNLEQNERSQINEKCKNIESAALNMLNLVNNIASLQKYEETNLTINKSDNSVLSTIKNSIKHVVVLLSQKNILIEKNIADKNIANYDEVLIERVIVNLLTNAIKFSPNNSTIKINCESNNEHSKISIIDNGNGIPKEMIPFLFNKYVRAEIRELGFSSSTGLGLAFSKLVINAHGGEIGVDSELGKGASFWFTLTSSNLEFENNVENISLTKECVFSQQFLNEIKDLKQQLLLLKFYETGEIQKTVQEFNCKNSEFIFWKKELDNAVLFSNKEKYLELIKL